MIVNPLTGERIRFVDEGTFEAGWPPRRRRVPEHVHPAMEERWEILAGRGAFRMCGSR